MLKKTMGSFAWEFVIVLVSDPCHRSILFWTAGSLDIF